MKIPPEKTGHEVLPEGAVRCVWMSAGLLTYKLCDRGLDCESCPFDAALKGRAGKSPERTRATVPRPAGPWSFPPDRRYAPGHTWVQVRPDNRMRVGLDALAAELASTPLGVELPEPGTWIEGGEPGATIHTTDGDLVLTMPMTGRVVNENPSLGTDPAAVVTDPYAEGWLLDLVPSEERLDHDLSVLLSSAEMWRKAHHDALRYQRAIAMELLTRHSPVGPTLQDGGEPIVGLRQLLSTTRHLEIVQSLLR